MAFSLGSSRWRVFRTVTLSLTVPGLANAFLLLFAASLADFATPLILAGNEFPVLPTEAYLQITGMFDLKGGAMLSLLLLVPAGIVYFLQRNVVGAPPLCDHDGQRARRHIAQRRRALGGRCADGVLSRDRSFHPLSLRPAVLIASLVQSFGANHTLTLAHYRVIFTEGLPAIKDTLIIALIGMPIGGLYGVIVGYLVARTQFVGQQAMEIVTMLNYALPGTIVGIAYLRRLQRTAVSADRDRHHHHRLLRVSLQPDRDPHHRRAVAADRPQHRGSLIQSRRL